MKLHLFFEGYWNGIVRDNGRMRGIKKQGIVKHMFVVVVVITVFSVVKKEGNGNNYLTGMVFFVAKLY